MGCSGGTSRGHTQCGVDGQQRTTDLPTLATHAMKDARDSQSSSAKPPIFTTTTVPSPEAAAIQLPHVPEQPLNFVDCKKEAGTTGQEAEEAVGSTLMNVCTIICEGLVLAGITHVFGGCGDDISPLINAICNHPKLTWVYTRIETSAPLIAAAYAKLTGIPGCCIANAGPGASNLATGLIDANLDRAPVICLTGLKNVCRIGQSSARDVEQLFKACGLKHSHTCLHPSSIVCMLRELLVRCATSHASVHMAVPLDVQQVCTQVHEIDCLGVGDIWNDSIPDSVEIDVVASHLLKCKQNKERALMAIGHRGVGEAATHALRLAEDLKCPIVTTLDAKGSVPEDHDQVIGVLGIFGNPGMEASAELVASATIVISIGVDDHSQLLVGRHGVQMTRLVEIDKQGLIDKRFQAEHILTGNVARVTELLADAVRKQLCDETGRSSKVSLSKLGKQRTIELSSTPSFQWDFQTHCGFNEESLNSRTCNYSPPKDEISEGYCHPGLVLKELGETLPQDAVVCVDVGDCALWVSLALCLTRHNQRCVASMRMGTMGYSIYGVIGAAAARPHSRIVGISGDGAAQMATNEFATIVQMGTPVVLIIFNNGKLGRVHNETWGPPDAEKPCGCELDNPDFCQLAEAYGGKGIRISESDPSLVNKALNNAFSAKCFCVVEVIQNPSVRPCMVKRKNRQLRTKLDAYHNS